MSAGRWCGGDSYYLSRDFCLSSVKQKKIASSAAGGRRRRRHRRSPLPSTRDGGGGLHGSDRGWGRGSLVWVASGGGEGGLHGARAQEVND